MESKPMDDDSEELLFSKRLRGRVRLPPLSRAVVTANSGFVSSKRQDHGEEEATGIFTGNTYPKGTENLIVPNVHQHPTSPSNLSIQFNFDEATTERTAKPKQLVTIKTQVTKPKRRSTNCQKRLKNSKTMAHEHELTNYKGKKGNNRKKTDDKKSGLSEQVKAPKVGRYQTISGSSAAKATQAPREKKGKVKTVKTITIPDRRLMPGALLDVNNNEQRKSSIYNLREFLSLPPGINGSSISPTVSRNEDRKNLEVKGKQSAKLAKSFPSVSPRGLQRKIPEGYTYNISEFLALTNSEQPSTGQPKKMLRRLKKEKVSKVQCSTMTGNMEIPAVVVADWSLRNDSAITKDTSNKNCVLPKANFPGDDFPESTDVLISPSEAIHRKSIYDLKEFLNLPEQSSKCVAKLKTKDLHLLSRECKPSSRRESEGQYDLREFLTFLESRTGNDSDGSGSGAGAVRPHTSVSTNIKSNRSRELSVYDIYEFLKATNSSYSPDDELQSRVDADDLTSSDSLQGNDSKGKPSIIDLTKFFAKSSSKSGRSLDVMREPTDEARSTQSNHSESRYDLTEFLRLSVAAEPTQTDTVTKTRSTFA